MEARLIAMDNPRYLMRRRIIVLFIVFVIGFVAIGIYSRVNYINSIEKTPLKVCLNSDTQEVFETQFEDKKDFNRYYEYEISSTSKEADFIFTSNIDDINTENEYTVEAYSPLIICLKDDKDAKNYLKTNTKSGFLTCNDGAKKIKDASRDNITCDFVRIIDVILKNGDWSDLGGEDKKITIYCPQPDTVEGELFYKFLLITLNNGKYPENDLEEIEAKAKKFLDSPNTIQTDIASRIEKLGEEMPEGDIYILFEADFLNHAQEYAKILITYPELTVIKQVYLQFNNKELKDKITDVFDDSAFSLALETEFFRGMYRNTEYPDLKDFQGNRATYFNVQDGFNYYELNN